MHRRSGGLLVAALLFVAGCGSNTTGDDASGTADIDRIDLAETPVLAAASSPSGEVEVRTGSFHVLVISPEGIDSPGLDAAVSTLLARPDTGVSVIAPAAPDFSPVSDRSTAALGLIDAHTMTGYPAQVVNGTTADAVATAFDGARLRPDLVIVGITRGAPVGRAAATSPAVGIARMIARHDVPVLVVASAGDEPDIAGTSVALTSLLDYELGLLVDSHRGPFVLTVPACTAGVVQGPLMVPHVPAQNADEPDCVSAASNRPGNDVTAYATGFATVADVGRG